MANAQSFPLLRLPNLAREHVIMIMDVREQYLFSNLSKKSERIVKNGTRLISYVFDLVLNWGYTDISIKKDWCEQELRIRIVTTKPEEKYCPDPPNSIILDVEDKKEQSIKSLVSLKDLFKSSRFKLGVHHISIDFTKSFLESVKNLGFGIDELEVQIEGDESQNEMYRWVMENFRDVKKLNIDCRTTRDFDCGSQRPFTFDYCYIRFAPWLSLGLLTRLFWSCRHFHASYTGHQMTNQDLKQLVKLWIEGNSKLEFLEIGGMNCDFQEVMADIEKVPVERAYIGRYDVHIKPGYAFKIKTKTGVEAVVCAPGAYIVITTLFDKKPHDLYTEYHSSDDEAGAEQDDEE
ncbi:unnamed protein product [Caenorhabditis brenneri]